MSHLERLLSEPVWRPIPRLMRSGIPEKYLPWLLDSASLTQRLISVCRGEFRVQLVDLSWSRAMRNEASLLNVRLGECALVRQVHLLCNGEAWVYARTIIPKKTLSGRERRLAHLRSRSLGAVLFSDPTMERDVVEVARLTPADRLFVSATRPLAKQPEAIWGRRSVYRLSGKPLMVSEIFLPTIGVFPE
jgi:chorismate lyase